MIKTLVNDHVNLAIWNYFKLSLKYLYLYFLNLKKIEKTCLKSMAKYMHRDRHGLKDLKILHW